MASDTTPPVDLRSHSRPKIDSSKYTLGKGDKFPTERRPLPRTLSTDPDNMIHAHVMKLKQAYLQEVPLLPRQKKMHDAEMEDCDGDFTKKPRLAKTPTKPSIRKTYVEKDEFTWGPDQELSFAAIKDAVASNAMSGVNPEIQFH